MNEGRGGLIDADRCWTEFISSSSFLALRVRVVAVSEIHCCLSLFLRPHAFTSRLLGQLVVLSGGGDAVLREKPSETTEQIRGKTLQGRSG